MIYVYMTECNGVALGQTLQTDYVQDVLEVIALFQTQNMQRQLNGHRSEMPKPIQPSAGFLEDCRFI